MVNKYQINQMFSVSCIIVYNNSCTQNNIVSIEVLLLVKVFSVKAVV